jgi:60 kDa SS-A/Ro ribonucleoprotein
MDYTKHLESTQQEQNNPKQAKNNAGGFSFVIDDWERLNRFLILGSEGGTYYVDERKLTRDNAKCVERCLAADGLRTVETAAQVSEQGRAPQNDAALFVIALASASKDDATRKAAFAALPRVARIGTHLFHYAAMVDSLRGWGTGLRNAVANWYLSKPTKKLMYQVVKYQQRDKWSHRDLLRLSHAQATSELAPIFRWVVGADLGERTVAGKGARAQRQYGSAGELPAYLAAFEELKACTDEQHAADLISEWSFTHEMVPTELKNSKAVWEALALTMPVTATMRNLNKLTQLGLLKPFSDLQELVVARLTDAKVLKDGRVHPMNVLFALNTYARGTGMRGHLTWAPEQRVVDALNDAFYTSFGTIEPTGKNHLLALDVSGSMDSPIMGRPDARGNRHPTAVNCREASAAMAMVAARTEPSHHFIGFTGWGKSAWGYPSQPSPQDVSVLNISPKQRLDDVVRSISGLSFGGTDCSLPMLYAMERKLDVDVFVVYTDNETWSGDIHPHRALEQYRQASGRNAKLIVVGMTATEFSIANPDDAGMLDVVGFDTAAPAVMADFARG